MERSVTVATERRKCSDREKDAVREWQDLQERAIWGRMGYVIRARMDVSHASMRICGRF